MVRFGGIGALGIVIAGVAVAALVGQVPTIGAQAVQSQVVTPSAAAQRLVCPGAAVAVGASGQSASAISLVGSATRRDGVATASGQGSTFQVKRMHAGNVRGASIGAPRTVTAPKGTAGVLAAAQSQTVTSGDATGFAATGCASASTVAWLVAGATTIGRTSVLLLANPSGVDATVTTSLWTDRGAVASVGGGASIVIPAGSRRAVSIAGLAPNAAATAIRVTTLGGLVSATLEQRTVRGLESGGIDLVGPTAAPATTQIIPGVRLAGSAAVAAAATADGSADLAPIVRLLVPGRQAANVTVTAIGASGTTGGASVTRHVDPGTVVDVPLAGLTDGTYTLTVRASRPIVAGVRTSVVGAVSHDAATAGAASTASSASGSSASSAAAPSSTAASGTGTAATSGTAVSGGADGGSATSDAETGLAPARQIDLAWFAAATRLGSSAAVAVATGPSPELTIANPTAARASVALTGKSGLSSTVAVPAGRSVTVAVKAGVLRMTGASGLVAALSYAGTAAVAGYPVTPASGAELPVRISY